MDALKEEIRLKIIHPLTHPDLYSLRQSHRRRHPHVRPARLRQNAPRPRHRRRNQGRLLSVGINDVLDMWIGNSERNLHALFEQARDNQPCVLFFDEVDALGARRTDMRTSGGRHLINQFLAEIDGIASPTTAS